MAVTAYLTAPVTNVSGSFTDSGHDGTGGSSFTIASLDFGSADGNRVLYAALTFTSNVQRSITGVSIGGVTASQVAFTQVDDGVQWENAAIYKAAVPTGTSGTVLVSLSGISGPTNGCGVGIYRTLSASSEATATDTEASAGAVSAGVTVVPGAYVIAACCSNNTPTGIAWTGPTEDYERAEDDTRHGGASVLVPYHGALTVTATPSGTPRGSALAVAAIK